MARKDGLGLSSQIYIAECFWSFGPSAQLMATIFKSNKFGAFLKDKVKNQDFFDCSHLSFPLLHVIDKTYVDPPHIHIH